MALLYCMKLWAGRAYKEVVELLVKAGADVHATCKAFWFPDDYYSNEVTNWWTVAARLGIALDQGRSRWSRRTRDCGASPRRGDGCRRVEGGHCGGGYSAGRLMERR